MGTDSLNVSANIDIDWDLNGLETFTFYSGHTENGDRLTKC